MRRPPTCNCHCKPPVNFRVFDLEDGTLLWERMISDQTPRVGMDGRVWEMVLTRVRGFGPYRVGVSPTLALPIRVPTTVSERDLSMYNAVSYDPETGDEVTRSPLLPHITAIGTGFEMEPTRYTLNSSGYYMTGSGGFAGTINLHILNNVETGPVEYWFTNTNVDYGTINLTTSPASETASFSISADIDTIEAEILDAFDGLYNSVTVTAIAGTNIYNGVIKVVIDWTLPTTYLAQISIAGRVQSVSGSVYNMETGALVSRGGTSATSSSYSHSGIWLTETKIVRRSSAPGDATQPIVEVWDTSTSPWTFQWSDDYANGHATYVGGESEFPIGIAARNGNAAVAMARMGSTPFSVKTYNESGSVLGTKDFAYQPERITLSEDTDEISAMFLQHSWSQLCGAHGLQCGTAEYCSLDGAAYGIMDITGGAIEQFNTGELTSKSTGTGFTGDVIAVVSERALSISSPAPFALADSSGGTIDFNNLADGPSGLSDPFAPANAHYSYWYIGTEQELLFYSVSWRLNFSSGIVTGWLDEDSTMADLNAELLTVFGSDIDGRQNVVASVWNSLPTYKSGMVPMFWQQYLKITARCARNSGEATASGMDLSLSASGPSLVKRLRVESLGYVSRRTASISVLDRSDGTEVWSRGFSASQPESPCRGVLHDGRIYCSVSRVIGAGYPGEL